MRQSLLRNRLAAAGATFGERHGTEVTLHAAARPEEYAAIRDVVGLTDFSFTRRFRVRQDQGLDFLVADCYVANNDEDFIVLLEPIVPDADLDVLLNGAGAAAASFEETTGQDVLLSLDGFKAWDVARKLFGADILGLPYLSVENCTFAGGPVRLFRAGKTSEFGYLVQAAAAQAEALFDAMQAEVTALGGRCCGVRIHDELRLEGRFFNIHAEGMRVRDPLPLGLQWMIDFEKPAFQGSEAIRQRRQAGLKQKIVGLAAPPSLAALNVGEAVVLDGTPIGQVVASCHSDVLGRPLGLALLPVEWAYAGLAFRLGNAAGPTLETVSMPPIMPRSLTVKLDEL